MKSNRFTGLKAGVKFIKTVWNSQYSGEKPMGVLFVAPPGTGKSYLLSNFKHPRYIITSDVTGRGLEELVKKMQKDTGYLVVPELIRAFSRRENKALLSVLNSLLEEGIEGINRLDVTFNVENPIHWGFMGAITNQELKNCYKVLASTGFLSRCLIFQFDYVLEDELKIEEYIASNGIPGMKDRILLDDREHKIIRIPKRHRELIKTIGRLVSEKKGEYKTFRMIKAIRRLVKGNAISDGRDYVNDEDIIAVYSLLPFIIGIGTDLDYFILKYAGESKNGILIEELFDRLMKKGYMQSSIKSAILHLKLRNLISEGHKGKKISIPILNQVEEVENENQV